MKTFEKIPKSFIHLHVRTWNYANSSNGQNRDKNKDIVHDVNKFTLCELHHCLKSGSQLPKNFPNENFQFWIFRKGSGHILSIIFQEKCFSCYALLTDQIYCLTAFTSWGIGKYVYCNCLLTRLWRHRFWN